MLQIVPSGTGVQILSTSAALFSNDAIQIVVPKMWQGIPTAFQPSATLTLSQRKTTFKDHTSKPHC